ncbi:uncharacterized protein Pyn_01471 [Prunus yedoensis var. nudiflora]|uniref:NADH-ubiquinone reductase complex 1 MLRQ subunit n=1 Tax=Prunus yedoensis var. nudiflora TaxID=2094558 RepID=A0A314USM5_PRUYE|nr:uncharacterized protein Pyn_01471 [Prunus yedoensis var. nudiflora]
MGRWVKPEVYPLMAAMTFVTSLCAFQLTRNVFLNPDVRIDKARRGMGVLENKEEGEKYAEHGLRSSSAPAGLRSCLPSTNSSLKTNDISIIYSILYDIYL